MLTLHHPQLLLTPLPMGTGWLLASCMEMRGKQDLWIRQKPELLEVLREQATIQSVESSNRIEGITVDAHRLRPLVIGKSRPRDRSEEELAGYRAALASIFLRKKPAVIAPSLIQRLHAVSQGGSSGDAGQWKARNNDIIEIASNGERRIRFTPVAAKLIPQAMHSLAQRYHAAIEDGQLPPLLAIATFVFDFLCIHPFRDGNGRVSRLTTTLLLQAHGFEVARYVSLERLIEESKHEYYRVLELCSRGWHEGKNEIIPWWNFFLGLIRNAYQEFERQVGIVKSRPAKSDLIRQTVLDQTEPFALADLIHQLPVASSQLIRKILSDMKAENLLTLTSYGRGATWQLANPKSNR